MQLALQDPRERFVPIQPVPERDRFAGQQQRRRLGVLDEVLRRRAIGLRVDRVAHAPAVDLLLGRLRRRPDPTQPRIGPPDATLEVRIDPLWFFLRTDAQDDFRCAERERDGDRAAQDRAPVLHQEGEDEKHQARERDRRAESPRVRVSRRNQVPRLVEMPLQP